MTTFKVFSKTQDRPTHQGANKQISENSSNDRVQEQGEDCSVLTTPTLSVLVIQQEQYSMMRSKDNENSQHLSY